jgi:peptide/nickel transport system substrate-binding protein
MKGLSHSRLLAPALLGTIALAGSLIPAATTSAHRAKAAPIYLTTYQNFKPTFIRNFNLFDPAARMDFTNDGIYESLMSVNVPPAPNSNVFPLLATSYAWSNGNKTLSFTIRPNAKWSDGVPLTAADVAFTFNYGKKYPVADQQGLFAKPAQLVSVTASGNTVSFNLTTVNTTIFRKIANLVDIIPQHIWSKITNPSGFANPNPVGSGPFTQVMDFSPQSYTLGKNPYYWEPMPFDGIHVPQFTDNTAAQLANDSGELDQTGNFIPGCATAYAAKDAAHFVCDYSTVGPVGLWFNDTMYPFSLPAFRKAVSQAIDRQKLYKIAEYGYEPPADALGVQGPWPAWADPTLEATAKQLATYNPAAAKAALTAAGFTYSGSTLMDPKGKPVNLTLNVINGWSDWDLGMQIMEQELKAIGINATVNLMTQPLWFDQIYKGTGPGGNVHMHWVTTTSTPYDYFFGIVSQESYTPIGTDASLNGQTNYERYVSPQATSLLKQFRETTDTALQHKLINQVEAIWLQDLPMIPLVYSADWSTYSTRHFTGWPTNANRYTSSSVNDTYNRIYMWSQLKPVM